MALTQQIFAISDDVHGTGSNAVFQGLNPIHDFATEDSFHIIGTKKHLGMITLSCWQKPCHGADGRRISHRNAPIVR